MVNIDVIVVVEIVFGVDVYIEVFDFGGEVVGDGVFDVVVDGLVLVDFVVGVMVEEWIVVFVVVYIVIGEVGCVVY